MAIYQIEAEGGLKAAGCGAIIYIKTYQTKFAPGDIVFSVQKARKGVIERVVIKKQKVINSAKTGGQFQVMYVDTYNGLWNEWDLISHSEALLLAQAYYEDLLIAAEALIKC